MPENIIIRIVLGLLAAALVGIVGPEITEFNKEGVVWGLIAVAIFCLIVFYDGWRARA